MFKTLEEKFEIKTYQCSEFGTFKLKTLFDYLQELASDHADKIGVGYEECLKKNCAWVCAKYHLVINSFPKLKDKISIETWPSKFVGPTGIREFVVKNDNGDILIRAVSQWVLIDIKRLRPVITQNVFDCSKIEPGEELGITLDKILPMSNEDVQVVEHSLCYDDVDVNHHINNAVYVALIEDSLMRKIKDEYIVNEVSVDFKKSAVLSDEKVLVKSKFGEDGADFTVSSVDGKVDFARVNVKYTKK